LTPGLVSVLVECIKYVHAAGKNEFRLSDLPLSHTGFCNAQKLRYWGLIHHVPDKRGFWLITNHGSAFLRGAIDMPVWVQTQDNHRIEKSEQRIHIRDLRGKIPEFQAEFISELPYQTQHTQMARLF
jgi:hypothetical protein